MEISIDEALAKGIDAHKAGRIQEADRFYTAILSAQPKHPDANHNMGILALDIGKNEEALPFFKAAVESNPNVEQFWSSYIDTLLKLDRSEEAQNLIAQAKNFQISIHAIDTIESNLRGQSLGDTESLLDSNEVMNQKTVALSELKLDKFLRLAKKKAKRGETAEAASIYQEILLKLPGNKKALSALAKLSVAQEPTTRNSDEPSPNQVEPLVRLYREGNTVELLLAIGQIRKTFPRSITLFNLQGVANTRLGRLDVAIESYQQALALDPNYAEAYNNMGSALNDKGDLDAAIESYQQALRIQPNYAKAYNNLGNALQRKGGREDAALHSYQQALRCKPNFADAYNNMGNILRRKGDFEGAINCFEQALKHKPDYPEAYNNIGSTLQDKGDLDLAIDNFGLALKLKPDYADALNNLGNSLNLKGDLDAAIDSYQKALELKPGFADAYNNIGVVLEEKGVLDAAIYHYQQAIKSRPDFIQAYINLGNILKGTRFLRPVPGLEDTIFELLQRKSLTGSNDISHAAISLLKFSPALQRVLAVKFAEAPKSELFEALRALSTIPLLLEIMRVSLIPDLEIESLFTAIRARILACSSDLISDPDVLPFCTALALQCFTNEYIYSVANSEIEMLEKLGNAVEANLNTGQQPEPIVLACLASYKSLKDYSWCHLLSIPDSLSSLELRQIKEPLEESRLRDSIPALQEITDSVSSKVREQYEANPYPRWVNLAIPLKPKSIRKLVKGLNLCVPDPRILDVLEPEILIAGCGTGQHSISTAKRFSNAKVVAVDLSLSSLAYAKRKTLELGIENIQYLQADILDLQKLAQKFGIIESSGVLHHMDEPMAGWRTLVSCLKPGGLIRIGLYSEHARDHIVRMRSNNTVNKLGSSPAEIRSFRDEAIKLDNNDYNRIVTSIDFFSLSTLRDLVFHVQEHRFTIPQIKACLEELGLFFCGFEFANKAIERKFLSENIEDDSLHDLEKWDSFENRNPNTFAEMYQFWCQKVY